MDAENPITLKIKGRIDIWNQLTTLDQIGWTQTAIPPSISFIGARDGGSHQDTPRLKR
jgi:hypothetical protein